MSREEVLRPHLGERQSFTASLTRITPDKILLTKVKLGDQKFDHLWVDRQRFEKKYGIRNNFRVSFTAVPMEYLGLDENAKQVIKCGVKSVSKLRYLYKLRKGQRK